MRRGHVVVARVLVSGAVTLAVIALAPVIVLVGEPLRRYYLRRLSQPPLRLRSGDVLFRVGLRRGARRRTAHRGRQVTGQTLAGLGEGRFEHQYSVGLAAARPGTSCHRKPGRDRADCTGQVGHRPGRRSEFRLPRPLR